MSLEVEMMENMMDQIIIEKYNPNYIASAVIFYTDGDYRITEPSYAIELIKDYQQHDIDGIACINFDIDHVKLYNYVTFEYKKLIKDIV